MKGVLYFKMKLSRQREPEALPVLSGFPFTFQQIHIWYKFSDTSISGYFSTQLKMIEWTVLNLVDLY